MAGRPNRDDPFPKGGSKHEPISLIDDDEDPNSSFRPSAYAGAEDIIRRVRQQRRALSEIIYVNEDDEALGDEIQRIIAADEADVDEEIARIEIDLTRDDDTSQPARRTTRRYNNIQRNPPLQSTHQSVQAHRTDGVHVKVADFVELTEPVGEWDIQFLEIKSIWVSSETDPVIIRGIPYSRNRNLGGRLEAKRNEVCQILLVNADDVRPDEEQVLLEITPLQILTKRVCNKTNAEYPRFRYGDDPSCRPMTLTEREEKAALTCRWKMRIEYKDARFRKACNSSSVTLVRFFERDIRDPTYRVSDQEVRMAWNRDTKPRPGHRYTFADMFCGSGGASRGAVSNGLELVTAVDHWDAACLSYSRNFPQAHLLNMDITDFITSDIPCPRVDILHISPPCQFWSPVHTRAGQDDETNIAALFVCLELTKKLRPRIVTLKQTFGLTHAKHAPFFNSLIGSFTYLGYSIQWRVIHLVEYGLPQVRRRLIIIASAPGEKLPPWPAATHGHGPGLKPMATEANAIRRIARNAALHDINDARNRLQRRARNPRGGLVSQRRDGNKPFPRTILCSGPGDIAHYDGTREHTIRELACLQGFPESHIFVGTGRGVLLKQIGNAFPPSVAGVLYHHLKQCLERSDGVQVPLTPSNQSLRRNRGSHVSLRSSRSEISSTREEAQYANYNGGVSEADALSQALRQSRNMGQEQSRARAITVEDSDDDMLIGQTTDRMDRLSLIPPDLSSSPGSVSSSASIKTPMVSWDFLRAPRLSSQASSATMGNSPSPSPSIRAKRKLEAVKTSDAGIGLEPQPKRERTRISDEDEADVQFLYELSASSPAMSGRSKEHGANPIVSSFTARLRREASIPIPEDATRTLSFGNKLGKLPVTRTKDTDWTF